MNMNYDCLFQIFSHLNLFDLLNFRLQCSSLNDAVCKFLPHLATLSIVYTEHDPIKKTTCKLPPKYKPKLMSVDDLIDDTFYDFSQKHFRRDDFIVISGEQNYENFLNFLEKYEMYNIKKLILITDPKLSYFPAISAASELLELCPKVETLFLERTNRCTSINQEICFKVGDLESLFETIAELSSLRELHFYGRQTSEISLTSFHGIRRNTFNPFNFSKVEKQGQEMIGRALLTAFQKLRTFSIHHKKFFPFDPPFPPLYLTQLLGQNFEHILELVLNVDDCKWLVNSGTKFPNLRSLRLFKFFAPGVSFGRFKIDRSFEVLRSLRFSDTLPLTKEIMQNLNALPKLEKLTADVIQVVKTFELSLRDESNRPVPEVVNQTIKQIEVKKACTRSPESIPCDSGYNLNYDNVLSNKGQNRRLYAFTDFFPSLQTITVSLPEVTVYDRKNFENVKITTHA